MKKQKKRGERSPARNEQIYHREVAVARGDEQRGVAKLRFLKRVSQQVGVRSVTAKRPATHRVRSRHVCAGVDEKRAQRHVVRRRRGYQRSPTKGVTAFYVRAAPNEQRGDVQEALLACEGERTSSELRSA